MDRLFFAIFLVISVGFDTNVRGQISFPQDLNPKKPCTEAQDCTNDNETCQPMGFCGIEACQSENDCKNIGDLAEGMYVTEGCNDGLCIYSQFAMMSSGSGSIHGGLL